MSRDGDDGSATNERRRCAIQVAQKTAARHGVLSDRPVILHDSNHTVIHLAPAPVVAKVNTSRGEASLASEVAIAHYLASMNSPVVPPTPLFPPGPHVEDGLEVTFWEYYPHEPGEPSPDVLGHSLRLLHDALDGYPGSLRPWDRFDGVTAVLADSSALGALPPDDRDFLRRQFNELTAAIASIQPPMRPLHGEPHSRNLLLSPDGPRWIDFESACQGPQEWDLTVLPDAAVAQYFGEVDWGLLAVLRRMRSLCVAVWCWLDPDRAPVLREAGAYHLALLKDGNRP
jgi:phosphotransferase family enzyme